MPAFWEYTAPMSLGGTRGLPVYAAPGPQIRWREATEPITPGWSANRKLSRNVRALSGLPRKKKCGGLRSCGRGSFDRVV